MADPVCELHADDRVVKFSVVHHDEGTPWPSFVHLQENGSYITCSSGTCKAAMMGKCATKHLLSLEESNVCPHLAIMMKEQLTLDKYKDCSLAEGIYPLHVALSDLASGTGPWFLL